MQKVNSLFTEYIGVETTLTNAIRIGKKGTKPRLLKVGITNLQEKISILRSKKKLRNEDNPEIFYYSRSHTPRTKKEQIVKRKAKWHEQRWQ